MNEIFSINALELPIVIVEDIYETFTMMNDGNDDFMGNLPLLRDILEIYGVI